MRVLVTGGVRSGKSKHAEQLLSAAPAVVYIAPGQPADGSDPDWDARVELHRARRPAHWTTAETADVAGVIGDGPALIDCLSTWLVAQLESRDLWEAGTADALAAVAPALDGLCAAIAAHSDVVVVTNEVGLGVVPANRSGVLFRDLLGLVNQRLAAVCDEVHLVICGRVLVL